MGGGGKLATLIWLCSASLNLYFISVYYVGGGLKLKLDDLSWSNRAAEEAEEAAAVSCSGHGTAYLDGLLVHGKPLCECTTCFSGTDCSLFDPGCSADADGGDPLFLEPFWMQHAASSALVVAGWHRMSYSFGDHTVISQELVKCILKVHAKANNAVTKGKFIIFGAGSTQLLNAAVYALSPENASSSAAVVASIPFYQLYEAQTDYFESKKFNFKGDASLWRNSTDEAADVIEFVTSPNNPDCQLREATLQGPSVKTIHDHAYYWPHFTPIPAPADEDLMIFTISKLTGHAGSRFGYLMIFGISPDFPTDHAYYWPHFTPIPAPADEDLMIFTISKLTGHAGSRFGWALVKDEGVYQRMSSYLRLSTMSVSRDTQLRALKLLRVILQGDGREIFDFAYNTMSKRWEALKRTISMSKRFSIQEIPSQHCIFYHKIREASPGYAWLKCEWEKDEDCSAVLRAAKIIGRPGNVFGAAERYVRLTLLRRQDEFDLLLERLRKVISEEEGSTAKLVPEEEGSITM